jgi:integrase
MATIETRKTSRGTTYRAKVRLKGHPAASRTFPSKSAAKAWGGEVEAEMRNGRYAPGSGHSLAEAIRTYELDRLPELSDRRTMRIHLEWWRRRLGHIRLRDLSVTTIDAALVALAREPTRPKKAGGVGRLRSAATRNRYKTTLSALLKWAQRRGWVTGNPARLIPARPENNQPVRFLSPEERERLLSACRNSRTDALYPATVMLLATGARLMEIMSLRWCDVDPNAPAITIHVSKNGDARRVPLPGDAVAVLVDWRARAKTAPLSSTLIFPAETDATKPADLRRSWQTALRRAEVTNFRRHDLRHSAASALASGGASLLTIGAVLGHRSASATKRYVHLVENDLRNAVERAAALNKVS